MPNGSVDAEAGSYADVSVALARRLPQWLPSVPLDGRGGWELTPHPPSSASSRTLGAHLLDQLLQASCDTGQDVLRVLSILDLVHALEDDRRALLVLRPEEAGRTPDACHLGDLGLEPWIDLDDRLILRDRGNRRWIAAEDGRELLAGRAGEITDPLGRGTLVLRVLRHSEIPAADRRNRLVLSGVRQHRHTELALDLRGLAHGVGIGPVAQERRVTRVKGVERLGLLIRAHTPGRDGADPTADRVKDARGSLVVDRDLSVVDEMTSAARGDPLERVAGQALVRVALPDVAVEVR